MFSGFRPIRQTFPGNMRTGAAIGFLERIIMVIFMGIHQYSAIGLVLTAKSIARYKMISEGREFGEYYLLGTLYSLLFSVIAFLALFGTI